MQVISRNSSIRSPQAFGSQGKAPSKRRRNRYAARLGAAVHGSASHPRARKPTYKEVTFMKRGGKWLRRSRWTRQRQSLCSRALAWTLVLALTAPLCGTICVYAEEQPGSTLCAHHTEHTEDCGYAPAAEGIPCGHVHDEACGYAEAGEGVPCGHVHGEACG